MAPLTIFWESYSQVLWNFTEWKLQAWEAHCQVLSQLKKRVLRNFFIGSLPQPGIEPRPPGWNIAPLPTVLRSSDMRPRVIGTFINVIYCYRFSIFGLLTLVSTLLMDPWGQKMHFPPKFEHVFLASLIVWQWHKRTHHSCIIETIKLVIRCHNSCLVTCG